MTKARARVLYVDVKWPTPGTDAASQRAVQLIGNLVAMGFEVDWAVIDPVEALGPDGIDALGGARPIPQTGVEEVVRYVQLHAADYELAVLAWTRVAQLLIDPLKQANPRLAILFDTVDVNHIREYRHARVSGNANILRRAVAMKAAEAEAMRRADLTIAITETDAAALALLSPGRSIALITLAASERSDPTPGPEGRAGLLFLGNLHAWHNVDAVVHLASDVMPEVRRLRPHMNLYVVGAGHAAPVDELQAPDLIRLGEVDDLAPVFDRARIFACPLRIGSGAKGKMLTALSMGLPIVTSAIGAEGMGLIDSRNCLVADTPGEFAAAVARLDVDDDLWRLLSLAGREHVRAHFSHDLVARQVRQVFDPYLNAASTVGEPTPGAAVGATR